MMIAMLLAAATTPDTAVRALVERFEAARRDHDAAALATTLAPDYEEISPVGDVDTRAQVIGFYSAKDAAAVPPMRDDQMTVRTHGDIALVTLRTSIDLPGGATRSLRVRHVAWRIDGAWQLLSTQYTPIPAPREAVQHP